MATRKPGRAIVTGASGGLGLATLRLLRKNGWQAAGLDLHRPEGEDGEDGEDGRFVVADVTDRDQVERAVGDLAAGWGGLDGLAHCAGIFRNTLTPVHETTDEDWQATIGVNVTGTFQVTRAVLPHLMAAGGGSIVLVASVGAANPQPGGAVYAASKAAVAAFSGAVALEYGGHGIRCNAVLPGYMDTRMAAPVLGRPHLREALEREIPIPRVADPAEVAEAISFLLDDAGSYVTGHQLVADGGATLTAMTTRRDLDRMWRDRG